MQILKAIANMTTANTTLEEGELEQSICSFAEKSWYEECEEVDRKMTVSLSQTHNCDLLNV